MFPLSVFFLFLYLFIWILSISYYLYLYRLNRPFLVEKREKRQNERERYKHNIDTFYY